nr:MAG TPA: hypothetical protein [Crassvirales sp.]
MKKALLSKSVYKDNLRRYYNSMVLVSKRQIRP